MIVKADVESGLPERSELPFYPLPAALGGYDTPELIQKIQRARDGLPIRALFLEGFATFLFTFFTIVPAGGLILTNELLGTLSSLLYSRI